MNDIDKLAIMITIHFAVLSLVVIAVGYIVSTKLDKLLELFDDDEKGTDETYWAVKRNFRGGRFIQGSLFRSLERAKEFRWG